MSKKRQAHLKINCDKPLPSTQRTMKDRQTPQQNTTSQRTSKSQFHRTAEFPSLRTFQSKFKNNVHF